MNVGTTQEIYIEATKDQSSIRQFPNNYCLAVWNTRMRCWCMDPDLAADKATVVALTLSLMEHSNKYSRDSLDAILGMGEHMNSYTPRKS